MYSSSEKPTTIKSKRGRKALAVSEGYIDVTGKTHIMTVRRLNPPALKKKSTKSTTSKSAKQCNNYCARCEKNDEYVDILNDRIGKLESLVEELTNVKKSTQSEPIVPQAPTFSNMGTEELVNLSNQISVELFERQLQTQTSSITSINNLTPPVSPFTACEDINAFTPFTQYQ